jgi:hypothetical protein
VGRGLIALALVSCVFAAASGRAQAPEAGAKLPAGGSAWEAFELTAVLDHGFRVTARFMITNEGPGERSAVNFGHVVRPGAPATPFQNGRREGAWRLSEDGRRIEIGSSLLVLADGVRHFEVDNDKRGIKLFLDWQQSASARSAPELIPGYRVDVLELATPVRASIQVPGMPAPRVLEGTLALTRTRAAVAESELVLRRIDALAVERGSPFYLLDLLGPKGARHAWLSLGTRPRASSRAQVGASGAGSGPDGYPAPKQLAISGPDFSGSLTLGEPILAVDPLAALPTFLRMVYSLRGRPHRSWIDAHFELSLAAGTEPARRLSGTAIAVLTFLDRLPPTPPHP